MDPAATAWLSRPGRERGTKPPSPSTMLAIVVATYGLPASGVFGMIWRDVVFLWRELPRVREWRLVQAAQGAALGIGLAFDDRDRRTARDLSEREARILT